MCVCLCVCLCVCAVGRKRGRDEWRSSCCLSARHLSFQEQAQEQHYKALLVGDMLRRAKTGPISCSPRRPHFSPCSKGTIEWKMEDVYLRPIPPPPPRLPFSPSLSLSAPRRTLISFREVIYGWPSVVNLLFAAKWIFNCLHESRDLTSSDPARCCLAWLAARRGTKPCQIRASQNQLGPMMALLSSLLLSSSSPLPLLSSPLLCSPPLRLLMYGGGASGLSNTIFNLNCHCSEVQ